MEQQQKWGQSICEKNVRAKRKVRPTSESVAGLYVSGRRGKNVQAGRESHNRQRERASSFRL